MPRITEVHQKEIWKANKAGISQRSIARKYPYSQAAISKFLKRIKLDPGLESKLSTPKPQPIQTPKEPTLSSIQTKVTKPMVTPKELDGKISSDQWRTAYFLLTGKTSRHRIEDVKRLLLKLISED